MSRAIINKFDKMPLAEREAYRALYAKARKMRDWASLKAVAAFLEMNPAKTYWLLAFPPPSEEQLDRDAEEMSERMEFLAMRNAADEAERRKWGLWRKQTERDEEREVKAQAAVCLIDALIEMEPYDDVGPKPYHFYVRSVVDGSVIER